MAFMVGDAGIARRTAITVGVGRVSMGGRVIGAAGGDAKLSGLTPDCGKSGARGMGRGGTSFAAAVSRRCPLEAMCRRALQRAS